MTQNLTNNVTLADDFSDIIHIVDRIPTNTKFLKKVYNYTVHMVFIMCKQQLKPFLKTLAKYGNLNKINVLFYWM